MSATRLPMYDTDLISMTLGPFHSALPGPMMLRLRLDGERIESVEVETGFQHKGLEKSFELQNWSSSVVLADHLDPEGSFFTELAVCTAVEELGELEVPARAVAIRTILSEVFRLANHLLYFAKVAKAARSDTAFHYVMRDREKLLDLIELLTGARSSVGFLRFGGVNADITEGFIERVLDVCDLLQVRLKEYNDLFTYNQAFVFRASGVGVLTRECALKFGITGPAARASGIDYDVRKKAPYLLYGKLDFEIPVGRGEVGVQGDIHDRFLVRLREIEQSTLILKQLVDKVPVGEFSLFQITPDFEVPVGESFVRVETSRGRLGAYVVSSGSVHPHRVQFSVPSQGLFSVVPILLHGCYLEELSLVLASLDLSVTELDR